MEESPKTWLGSASEAAPQIVANLRKLLHSTDIANLQIALELLKGGGVPDALLPEIVAITLVFVDDGVREDYKHLLDSPSYSALNPLLAPLGQMPRGDVLHAMLEAIAHSGLLDPHAFSHMVMLCDPQWMPFALQWMTKDDLETHALFFSALHIEGPYFRELPPAIAELSELCVLEICEANLTEVPDHIEKIKGLKDLDLMINELESLPMRLLEVQTLEQLILPRNQFAQWPDMLRHFPHLETIDFTGNYLDALPDDIPSYPALRTLGLNGCYFQEMPAVLFEMGKLEHLGYDYSGTGKPLTEIPAEIGRLTNLQTLSMAGHPITCLPDAIRNLKMLTELQLSNTQLEELPDWLPEFHSLSFLWIHGCDRLQRLPDAIGQLKCLAVIDMGGTSIDRLPDSFAALVAIQEIHLPGVAFADEAATIEILAQLTTLKSVAYGGYPDHDFVARLRMRLPGVKFQALMVR